MGVLDRLPENSLSEELKHRKNDNSELKGSFQSLGSTSVVTHRIFSPDAYDVRILPAVGVFNVYQIEIEFIPDDKTFGGAFCYRMFVDVTDATGVTIDGFTPNMERRASTDGKQEWTVYLDIYGFAGDDVRFKFYFFTTGSGTFTTSVVT